MKYDYDLITIGLGPAGMAVSIMGSAMGLKVCGIEKNSIGGECMNVGCIPSKALLRMGKMRSVFDKLAPHGLGDSPKPEVKNPFSLIQKHLEFISEKKTISMFDKVELVYKKGAATFVDAHTVEVAGKTYSAKRIFICTGTSPQVPAFEGIENIDILTNENMFSLSAIPASLIVIGGGAIACEMAQAFAQLGSKVTIVIRGPRLMWREDNEATDIIEKTFEKEGITILRETSPKRFEKTDVGVKLITDKDETVEAERVLIAAGRTMNYDAMKLENADVRVEENGAIKVRKTLQTTRSNIYACGDCNGYYQFSHAAMHQGMIALMNSMSPWLFRQSFKKFVVPWTVFTTPQFSQVGPSEAELKKRGVNYKVIKVNHGDYGAAIAENVPEGFVRVLASPLGKVYSCTIIGEGSGEMINEWALIIQKGIRLHDVMMLQHSFPTMGFLSKRISETWMMEKMEANWMKSVCRLAFRLLP